MRCNNKRLMNESWFGKLSLNEHNRLVSAFKYSDFYADMNNRPTKKLQLKGYRF